MQQNRATLESAPTQLQDIRWRAAGLIRCFSYFTGIFRRINSGVRVVSPSGGGVTEWQRGWPTDQSPELILGCESVLKVNHELGVSQPPVANRHSPLLWNLGNAHINDLANSVIGRKNRLGFSEFSDHSMVAFDGIRRIYYLPDLLRIFKRNVAHAVRWCSAFAVGATAILLRKTARTKDS